MIEISLEGLEIGDSITISDVKLPEGAKPTIDRDFVIANLSAPSALKSEDDGDEDEDGDVDVPTVGDEDAAADEGGEE